MKPAGHLRSGACGVSFLQACGGKAALWLVVLSGLLTLAAAKGPINCSCDVLPIPKAGDGEVCGLDGLPYASACLAICQGVPVADSPSFCMMLSMNLVQRGPSGPVYKRDMRRFEEAGYRWVGYTCNA